MWSQGADTYQRTETAPRLDRLRGRRDATPTASALSLSTVQRVRELLACA